MDYAEFDSTLTSLRLGGTEASKRLKVTAVMPSLWRLGRRPIPKTMVPRIKKMFAERREELRAQRQVEIDARTFRELKEVARSGLTITFSANAEPSVSAGEA